MKRLQRAALLTALVEKMRDQGSWCGETHLQKATFVLQDLLGVDFGYDFVVYKHGPFSFDLRDDLGGLMSDKLVRYEPQVPPYGPRIAATSDAANVQAMYPKTMARHEDRIAFVADTLDARGVVELERLATALYVTLATPELGVGKRANSLRALKPHIPEPAALDAVNEIDAIRAKAAKVTTT